MAKRDRRPIERTAGAERLKLQLYLNGFESSPTDRWKDPNAVKVAMKQGAAAYNEIEASDRGVRPLSKPDYAERVTQLRSCVELVFANDKWVSSPPIDLQMNAEAASAFEALVKRVDERGKKRVVLPPHVPTQFLRGLRQENANTKGRRRGSTDRWRILRRIQRRMAALARDCDDYGAGLADEGGELYDLEPGLAGWLRSLAESIDEFLSRTSPVTQVRTTVKEFRFKQFMEQVRVVTGSYGDTMIVELLNGTVGVAATSEEALRKFRSKRRQIALMRPGSNEPIPPTSPVSEFILTDFPERPGPTRRGKQVKPRRKNRKLDG